MHCTTLLLLALLCLAHAATPCTYPLCGTYQNQLGSTLVIEDVIEAPAGISFYGTYHSKVGKAKGSYLAIGAATSFTPPATLGFTVTWVNLDTSNGTSTTSWTGLMVQGTPEACTALRVCDPVSTYLITQWHLTTVTTPQDYWAGTLSGFDVFSNVTSV